MKQIIELTWEEVQARLLGLTEHIKGRLVYGVPNGGFIAASLVGDEFPHTWNPREAEVILDDIEGTGETRMLYERDYPQAEFIPLYRNVDFNGAWVSFPWERQHPAGNQTIEGNITRILTYIGEDPKRDGLKDTPMRVIKSYKELFSGYGQDPKDLFKTFEGGNYQSMVLLKDIEMYSMCEHHMIPFFGKAHVAYIPNDFNKIIGISKLARLVDLFSRQLQVQERICEQVTDAIMEYLQPKGAACVIEAVHMCMCARGVGKQHSSMVTSSLKGVFRTELAVREEFMNLISKRA